MAHLTLDQEKQLRDAFNLFDEDRSGQLSKKELKNVLKALHVKVNALELQVLLNQMDVNKNGEVDFDEFKAVMSKSYYRQNYTKELEATFKKYDLDGNGFLTIDELQNIMANMGRHMTVNEVKSMIQSLDVNKDGKISFDEFLKLFN